MEIGLGAVYSEEVVANGMTSQKADMIFASIPYKIMHEFQIPLDDQMRERDAGLYAGLENAGFGSMNAWAADLISQEVADKVGKCGGLGSDTPKDPGSWEGEQRHM